MANEEAYVYHNHLKELHSSDFEMATGEPDIRRWRVVGLHNQPLGNVNELLFDEISHRIRYLVLNIDGGPLNLLSRPVLVPIGLAELLRDDKLVVISGLTVGQLASLPTYEKGKITSVTEHAIRTVISPSNDLAWQNDRSDAFYEHEHFQDDKFYRPRNVVIEKNTAADKMRDDILRVKERVKIMEEELENLERSKS